ncbi:hypothetical protein FGO68_gene9655 [Halteria grandinella]|uniref:Protein kinase domain-containing protein n=1 Tax=Halteria grandinella TaxID=5974 RepID=A0A8J8SVV8_HALGN|nr:hypothetical protein FGO68_gene9655 [Halteria grandinella]
MLSTNQKQTYDRIVDQKFGVLNAFDPSKDQSGLSIVRAVCLETLQEYAVKVMGNIGGKVNPEFQEEAVINLALPDGNPRLVKAISVQYAYDGMPAYPLFEDDSLLHQYSYMVMPLAKRGSLLQLLLSIPGSKSAPKNRAYQRVKYYLCSQAVLAVAALFKAGLCHKDLKVDNLVLLQDNELQALLGLIDFGYCINNAEPTSDKRGTPVYAPPEKFQDEMKTVDPTKFDIFMLGALLITIIFRDTPFSLVNKQGKTVRCECINDPWYNYYILRAAETHENPLMFFKKWGSAPAYEDIRALNLIVRMIDSNPINRPSLDEVLADPFIQQYCAPMTTEVKILYDSLIQE